MHVRNYYTMKPNTAFFRNADFVKHEAKLYGIFMLYLKKINLKCLEVRNTWQLLQWSLPNL